MLLFEKMDENPFFPFRRDGDRIVKGDVDIPVLTAGDVATIRRDRFLWPVPAVVAACMKNYPTGRAALEAIETECFAFHLACLFSSVRPGSASLSQALQHVDGDGRGVLLGKLYPGAEFAFRYRARKMSGLGARLNTLLAKLTMVTARRTAVANWSALSGTLQGVAPLQKTPSWDHAYDYEAAHGAYLRAVERARTGG